MAAPTFVKKKQLGIAGGTATPDAVSLASASTAGNLLVLLVISEDDVTTPTGWTRDVNALSGGAGGKFFVYHKTSAGETTVSVTVSDFNHARDYNLLEYAGLTSAALENPVVSALESPTSLGVGIMPAVPYGAGPRVILGAWSAAGPGATPSSATNGYTMRTPSTSADAFKEIGAGDILQDTTAGTKSGGGTFLEVGNGPVMCIGLVYMDAPVLVAQGSLVGKYIGLDAAVTSPFTGIGQELDAIFAINLSEAALPSALLYGPDLNHAGTPSSAPLILEDGTIAILEDGTAAMGETTYS